MANIAPGFMDGQSVEISTERFHTLCNPATGESMGRVYFASTAEIEQAVKIAVKAFSSWSATTPIQRTRVLFKFRTLLELNIEKIATLLTEEHGKVLADARGEVMRAIELVEHCCSMPQMLQGQYSQQVGRGVDCYTIRQPLGVCVGVSPFNFPVMIAAWLAIPALACGNSFVLKPSEKTPSSVLLFARLLQQAGLPDGVFNVINGDKEAVDCLIRHPDVVAVSCVASTPVAETIYQTAIAHGKRAQAFGSAKNHAVVMPDAHLDDAVANLLGAGFGAAGERCMAISVVVAVTDAVGDALAASLRQAIPALKITSGLEPDVDMGPLISEAHRQRVLSYIDLGVEEGAELLVDGRGFQVNEFANGFFMGASLFDHVTADMRIYQEEIFGPVLSIVRVNDYQAAVDLINAHQYGNGVALFTQHGGVARQFAADIQVGMVGINVPIPVPVAYHAFGGWKRSVFGDVSMHGEEGMRFYTKTKSITLRWPQQQSADASFIMPTSGD